MTTIGYDEVERKFGISAYASHHEGFAAVVKARYSDFVVHEVDLNGNVARLESLETSSQQQNDTKEEAAVEEQAEKEVKEDTSSSSGENSRKRKLAESAYLPIPDSDTADGEKCSSNNSEDNNDTTNWDSHRKDLSKLIGETPANEVVTFLQRYEEPADGADDEMKTNDVDVQKKFYTLPVISDKEIRRSVHFLLKSSAFKSMALADNHEGRIRIWHKKFAADMPADTHSGGRGGGDNRNRNNNRNNSRGGGGKRGGGANNNNGSTPWPRDRPDFLRFILYKENIDTTTAAKDVVRMARLNPKRGISYAGMKDKRGITTQFCSAYRVEKEQLLAVNARGGNSEFAENAVNNNGKSSSGGGNTQTGGSCIIRLGNFEYSSEEVKLGALTGNRFDIVLRNIDVGGGESTESDTDKRELVRQKCENAGRALKTHGFINYFGMQRFGKFHDTHEVGISILKGDFEGAINIIMREKTDESPRVADARRQWARRFESIDDSSKDEDAARDAEAKVARIILRDMGRFMVCEKSIVTSLSRKPRDYKRAFSSVAKNMRSMFLHAYQSYLWNMVASHRIESGGSTEVREGDLVLVEDRAIGEGGSGTSGLKGKSVKLLKEEDVKSGKFSIMDVVLPLAGSKIIYPEGSTGELFEELMKKDGLCKADFGKVGSMDKELFLGGDYRKLICKPLDVSFEVQAYTDPLQPLLQTDLMKATGVDITAITLCTDKEEDEEALSQSITKDNQENNADKDQEGKSTSSGGGKEIGIVGDTIFGMIVGFSLPPSSYATIALRELTKRPTSSEYQSRLELSGKCERNAVCSRSSGDGSP